MVVPSRAQLSAGAVWVTIANWADAFQRRFGDVEIVTPVGSITADQARRDAFSAGTARDPNRQSARFVNARTFAKDLRWVARGLRFDARIRRRLKPDPTPPFVWQHHDLFQTAGATAARRLSVPLVLFVDAPLVWEARKWGVRRRGWGGVLQRIGEVPTLRRADLVACVSAEVADEVIRLGVNPERVLVTPCSAEVPSPRPSGLKIRAGYGLEGAFVIGWVGSFRAFHALDLLIDAFTADQISSHNVALLLVGDGVERQRILERGAASGIRVVAPGSVPHAEVFEHVAAFDCGVLTVGADQAFHYSPLKLKEYLAMGTPVVAPAIGEMAQDLTDGVDALLYPPGNVGRLSDQLQLLIVDEGKRRQIGEQGEETFRKKYSMEAQVNEVERRLAAIADRMPA